MRYIRYLIILIISLSLMTCSGDSQFTKKLVANPFIAELFGETTKTISVDMGGASHIAWLGLEWTANYKYFRIEQIKAGGVVTVSSTGDSTALFENVSMLPSESTSGGVLSESPSEDLQLKITYSPLSALEDVETPHVAYLLIVTDGEKTGTIRVELNGFVKGICDSETDDCNSVNVGSMIAKPYQLAGDGDADGTGDLALYLCDDPLIDNADQTNDPAHPHTNLTYINVEENFVFYLSTDGTELHIVRSDAQSVEPTIPEFGIKVPPGTYDGVNIPDDFPPLPVSLFDGQDVTCPVDSSGNFECSGIEVEVGGGIVGVTPLIMTNGTVNPVSNDCDSFSSGISGTGDLNDPTMTIVGWGFVDNSINVPSLEDALVVVKIPLKLVK